MSEFPVPNFVFETAAQRWLKRLLILVGVGVCVAALALVFGLEYYAIKKARDVAAVGASAVTVKADAVDKANDGKLVVVVGDEAVDGDLKDEQLGVTAPKAVRLRRKVEMLQWKEKPQPKKDGKDQPPKYELEWSESLTKSTYFKEQTGHVNPDVMPLEKASWQANNVKLGAFTLAPTLIAKMTKEEPFPVSDEQLAKLPDDWKALKSEGGQLVRKVLPGTQTPGDLRITYTVVKPEKVTVMAGQNGSELGPFKVGDAYDTEELLPGEHNAKEMVAAGQATAGLVAWVGRVLGWAALLVAFFLLLPSYGYRNTRVVMPHTEPVAAAWIGAFAAGFALATLLVGLGFIWLVLAPGLGVAVVAPGLLGLAGLYLVRHPRQAPPPPEREPQPVQPPTPVASLPPADPMGTIKRLEGKVVMDEKVPGKPVVEVSLASTGAGDMDLAHLRRLTTLRVLNLESCYGVTDGGLAYLADLAALQELNLDSTGVDGDGLVFLSKLASLKKLTLPSYRALSTGHLELLASLPQLEELKTYLRDRVDDKFKVLARFPKLKRIDVDFSDATDAGLAALKGMANLQELKVRWPKNVTDEGLKHLAGKATLRELDLYGAKLTDAGLATLCTLPNLEILRLTGETITNAGLVHLKTLTKLRELHLVATGVTDAGLQQLAGLKNLKHLSLDSSPVTGSGLDALIGVGLEALHLDDTKFGDATAGVLKNFPNLKELDLDNAALTDAGLANLRGLVKLNRLMLDGTKITTAGLEHLRGLRELKWLRLDNNKKITDNASDFLKGLGGLEKLNVEKTKMTNKGIVALQAALPKTEISH